jgi:4-oxalocrotonate tautomerase
MPRRWSKDDRRATNTSGRVEMPYVQVQMLEGRSDDQKKRLAKAITDALIEIANAKLEACEVVIEEYPRKHWMTAGKMMSES